MKTLPENIITLIEVKIIGDRLEAARAERRRLDRQIRRLEIKLEKVDRKMKPK